MYTRDERSYCDSKGAAAAASYAGRFAAKEAFLKALKTGWRGKISWHEVEVVSNSEGVPSFDIKGEAKRLLDSLGAAAIHLSISHTTEHAVAQVVLERSS